jgi:hypothetical protein
MICIYLYFFAYSDIQSTLYGCTTMYSTHKNCYDAHTTNRYILHTWHELLLFLAESNAFGVTTVKMLKQTFCISYKEFTLVKLVVEILVLQYLSKIPKSNEEYQQYIDRLKAISEPGYEMKHDD